ncbi:MAG: sulfatase-like hydrolase/transferase [Thalassotalea sp.]|nr:sulfatase-like hydrolase/transferase [Thalassotalea sp.]
MKKINSRLLALSTSLTIFCLSLSSYAYNSDLGNKPNVILLMSDDQGWGDVAYNGNDIIKTPSLDKMATESIKLDRFYAASPVCSPTRGSVLTGRHPSDMVLSGPVQDIYQTVR